MTGVTGQKEAKKEREKEEKEETMDLKTQSNEGDVALCRLHRCQKISLPPIVKNLTSAPYLGLRGRPYTA